MSRPVTFTKALAASGATVASLAQTLGAAGNLLINGSAATGGVATLDTARRILFTTTEDDSALTYTIYGTNQTKSPIVETGTLPNSTTKASSNDFLTVTRIAVSGAIGANISVGTNGVGSSPWVLFDPYLTPAYLSLVCQLVTGTGNMSIEYTADSFLTSAGVQGVNALTPVPFAIAHASLQSIAATAEGAIDFPIVGWRMTINSGTGTWKVTGIQSGLIQ